jgi:hypothetical protein
MREGLTFVASSLTVTISLGLQYSTASKAVIIFVVLAMSREVCASFSKSTLPVAASIKIALAALTCGGAAA